MEWDRSTDTLSNAVWSSEVEYPGSRFIADEGCDGDGPFRVCQEDDIVKEQNLFAVTSCVYRKGKLLPALAEFGKKCST